MHEDNLIQDIFITIFEIQEDKCFLSGQRIYRFTWNIIFATFGLQETKYIKYDSMTLKCLNYDLMEKLNIKITPEKPLIFNQSKLKRTGTDFRMIRMIISYFFT